ncbi:threonine synthase [Syntrophothermus lipocalidus DSM 12680]|uniref:Threonine synthase n=2 Tax=Syntrophothermus TaxID=129001 RepID=D7CP84_SYNLT|nr:threonine synthase [Syntrophothermus lipocalidus DSM 12680]
MMKYVSTRGQAQPVSSAEAIKLGIAPDGGLFVPEEEVRLKCDELAAMRGMNYQERAVMVLTKFLTDFLEKEIKEYVDAAYSPERFDHPHVAPVARLDNSTYILELWHGPTCAFKDMALQLLPHLLTASTRKTGEKAHIAVLVATSGDTGKAALEGFKDVPGTSIIVFYPAQGVSQVQERQMVTQEGSNVHVVAVEGNFDDAQNGVKAMFQNQGLETAMAVRGIKFSSANSINWGRLVPQVVYYISAYLDLVSADVIEEGMPVNFVVPTGNFGNILAAFYSKQMGLPINKLICAANANNVLTDFINSGVYDRNRSFKKTISPSMDILISSNLERLLYEITEHNDQKVRDWMDSLRERGRYEVDSWVLERIQNSFWSDFATDEETKATIRDTYNTYGYLLDTHTAVGKKVYDRYVRVTGDTTPTVIASTASPFKFAGSVAEAVFGMEIAAEHDEFGLSRLLSEKCNLSIPKGLQGLETRPIRHYRKVLPEEMANVVLDILSG